MNKNQNMILKIQYGILRTLQFCVWARKRCEKCSDVDESRNQRKNLSSIDCMNYVKSFKSNYSYLLLIWRHMLCIVQIFLSSRSSYDLFSNSSTVESQLRKRFFFVNCISIAFLSLLRCAPLLLAQQ